MNDPTFGIKWNVTRLSDLHFADDLALLGDSVESLQAMTNNLPNTAAKVGLKISTEKTKIMSVKKDHPITVQVNNQNAEEVESFTYLGSNISNKGNTELDIFSRLGKANSVFRRLHSTWMSKHISLKSKITLYNSLVIPVVIYASETWKMTEKMAHTIDIFHQRCLRKLLGVTWKDKVSNEDILQRSNQNCLSTTVKERRLRMLGHVLQMQEGRHPKTSLAWTPEGARGEEADQQQHGREQYRKTWRQLD